MDWVGSIPQLCSGVGWIMYEVFDLICPFCLHPFLDVELLNIKRTSKIYSDGSGYILFNCNKCGSELKSQIMLKPPTITENFKPVEES